MASNVIVKQHIDDFLVTNTLADAQSALGIDLDVTTVVRANSAHWGEFDQAALDLKVNRNNPVFTGLLSAVGPMVITANTSINALKITQLGTGSALVVEDIANDSTPFVVTSGGNVGVGKMPTDKFEVQSGGNIARFTGTGGLEHNGISIDNALASNTITKSGYVDFRNENNVTVSRLNGNINTDGSSDIVVQTTPSGDRTIPRISEKVIIKGNGNVGIGMLSPTSKLHVDGDITCNSLNLNNSLSIKNLSFYRDSTIVIPSSARVFFGNDFENSDTFFIQRINTASNKTDIRICLGDDPQATSPIADTITIGVSSGNPSWFIPWQPKIVFSSNGFISCFGDYTPSQHMPLTAQPAMPVNPEHLTTKKYVDRQLTPAGAIMTFAMSAAPSGWLYCDGRPVSRTGYSRLFAAIGTTYGAGDGSNTFNLPDLRGEFIRGWDDGRGIDSGRTFGSTQKGTITIVDPNLNSLNVAGIYSQYEYNTNNFAPVAGYDIVNISDYAGVYRAHIPGTGFGALETNGFSQGATRPRNIALYYCIKD